ncbi:MAG: hypothetical protein IKK91_01160 [Ruminococcus sp.]|nr:hypothetical protein [Ruminococcus sp.]
MNELRFLEIIGKIDDDLISGAITDTCQKKDNRVITKRNIYAFASVVAAAVITVGSVVFYNVHKPSELISGNSSVLTGSREEYQYEGNNDDGVISDIQKGTASTTAADIKSTNISDSVKNENTDTLLEDDSCAQNTDSSEKINTTDEDKPVSTTAPTSHTQAVTQTETPVQSTQKAQTSQPAEPVSTSLTTVPPKKEEPTDFDDLPYAVHTDLDVSYEEAKERFGHDVTECTRSDFLGYKIGIVSRNGNINSGKTICLDVTYKFTNGIISIIDQDRMDGSRATYGTKQYDYLDRTFNDETFVNDEQITIGYYPDNDNGLAYVAVFDRSADIFEIMDMIISLEI